MVDIIPELNNKQLDRLSEFLANLSLVVIASMIIPNLIGVDKPDYHALISGLLATIILLLGSLIIVRKDYD